MAEVVEPRRSFFHATKRERVGVVRRALSDGALFRAGRRERAETTRVRPPTAVRYEAHLVVARCDVLLGRDCGGPVIKV